MNKPLHTFELSNGKEMAFESLGAALEYCHKYGLKVVRQLS